MLHIPTIVILCLAYYIYKIFTYPTVHSVGKVGYRDDILLPHTHPIELYHCGFSSNSQKVRAILMEAEVEFKSIHVMLPTSGSYDTKTAAFLAINPAGTVPVLVHNGHPIYESHEQVKYIQDNLMSDGKTLALADPKDNEEMELWLKQTAMGSVSNLMKAGKEGVEAVETEIRKSAGNVLPCMTMPFFAAHIILNVDWWTVLKGLLMAPLLTERGFLLITVMYKIKGVEFMKEAGPLYTISKAARCGLLFHLKLLEEALGKHEDGPYLFGSHFTMADVGWVPILDRMEQARWWSEVDRKEYPRVWNYWETIQERPSFQKAQASPEYEDYEEKIGTDKAQVDEWKQLYPWFSKIYTG